MGWIRIKDDEETPGAKIYLLKSDKNFANRTVIHHPSRYPTRPVTEKMSLRKA